MLWDEASGMYFDTYSGFYWDQTSNLFCGNDGNVAKYYHWNQRLGQYLEVETVPTEGERKTKPAGPCFRCGEDTHLKRDCPYKTIVQGECFRCGKSGHFARDCPNRKKRGGPVDEQDLLYDESSDSYFDQQSGLYYDKVADLYYDKRMVPFLCYHWNPATQAFMRVKSGEEVVEEGMEESKTPNRLLLVLTNKEDGTAKGEHLIGESVGQVTKGAVPSTVFTLGRGKTNNVVLQDLEASKLHAKIIWENVFWENWFWLVDIGSTNGTFLNGKRLSEPRVPSPDKEYLLQEGDVFEIGSTRFTVARPDPSLVMAIVPVEAAPVEQPQVPVAKEMSNLERRRMVFKLTKEEKQERDALFSKYSDRAAARRELHGLETPLPEVPKEEESPQVAVETKPKRPETSVGFQLLQKMGWKKGEGLGKESGGIVEPVKALSNDGKNGLGFGKVHVADGKTGDFRATTRQRFREKFEDILTEEKENPKKESEDIFADEGEVDMFGP